MGATELVQSLGRALAVLREAGHPQEVVQQLEDDITSLDAVLFRDAAEAEHWAARLVAKLYGIPHAPAAAEAPAAAPAEDVPAAAPEPAAEAPAEPVTPEAAPDPAPEPAATPEPDSTQPESSPESSAPAESAPEPAPEPDTHMATPEEIAAAGG